MANLSWRFDVGISDVCRVIIVTGGRLAGR
jgi:hypothetical protein